MIKYFYNQKKIYLSIVSIYFTIFQIQIFSKNIEFNYNDILFKSSKYLENKIDNNIINSFDFSNFSNQNVNERTGVFNFSYNIGTIYGKNLSIPYTLKLLYYQNTKIKHMIHFGRQWGLNITYFDKIRCILYLNGDKIYNVIYKNKKPYLEYDKEINTRLSLDQNENLIIHSKNGNTEYLNSDGKPYKIRDKFGNYLLFFYDSDDGSLEKITDESGSVKISTNFKGIDKYFYTLSADGKNLLETKIKLTTIDNEKIIKKIFLPQPIDKTDTISPGFQFTYLNENHYLIQKVTLPTYGKIMLTYTSLLSSNNIDRYSAVKSCTLESGHEQPPVTKKYYYDDGFEHNYLGHNPNEKLIIKNIFEAKFDYKYTTDVDDGKKIIRRTYNKYNLIEKEEIFDRQDIDLRKILRKDSKNKMLKNVFNKFTKFLNRNQNNDTLNSALIETTYIYPFDLSLQFHDLPKNYAFPIKKEIRYRGSSNIHVTSKEYNENGNLISKVNDTGLTQLFTYCGKNEENQQCKSDGSGFEHDVKSITIIAYYKNNSHLKIKKNYSYKSLPSRDGISSFNVKFMTVHMDEKNNAFLTIKNEFIEDKNDDFYGKISKKYKYFNNEIISYQFDYKNDEDSITELRSVGNRKTLISQFSNNIHSNKKKFELDKNGINYKYQYDDWGRLILNTKYANTNFEQMTHYEYQMNEFENAHFVVKTNSNNTKIKTEFDNLGRVLKTYQMGYDSIDSNTKNQSFIITNSINFDEQGLIKNLTKYNISYKSYDQPGTEIYLTTHFKYDFLNRPKEITYPNFTKKILNYDNDNNSIYENLISQDGRISPRIYIKNKISHDPKTKYFNKVKNLIYSYIPKSEINDHFYDSINKTIKILNSTGQEIFFKFNLFNKIHEISIKSKENNIIIFKRISYDDAGRVISEFNINNREKKYFYDDKNILIEEHIQKQQDESGFHIVKYTYHPDTQFLLSRSLIGNCNEDIHYIYDSKLNLSKIQDKTGETNFIYFDDGKLNKIIFSPNYEKENYHRSAYSIVYHKYDRFGKIVQIKDANNQMSTFTYNSLGNLENIYYLNDKYENFEKIFFSYDVFNRLQSEYLEHARIEKLYNYNDFSKITTLDNIFLEKSITKFNLQYDNFQNLEYRNRINLNKLVAHETFKYDNHKNILKYTCEGLLCPKSSHENKIIYQNYTLNEFNNISKIFTFSHFKDNGNKIDEVEYFQYSKKNPFKLIKYSKSPHSSHENISYDLNGNLISDELNNTYKYNEFDQLITIMHPNNKSETHFIYDHKGRLVLKYNPDMTFYPLEYIYCNEGLINEKQGNKIASYLQSQKGKIAKIIKDYDTKSYFSTYYIFDEEGSIVNELGSQEYSYKISHNNNIISEKLYTPYGLESSFYYHQNKIENFDNYKIEKSIFGFHGQLIHNKNQIKISNFWQNTFIRNWK